MKRPRRNAMFQLNVFRIELCSIFFYGMYKKTNKKYLYLYFKKIIP